MNTGSPAGSWNALSSRVMLWVNLGWFWQRCWPLLTCVHLVFVTLVLLEKSTGWDVGIWPWYAGICTGVVIFSFWQARQRWFSRRDAEVHLETVLGLNGRLSAARENVVPWPTFVASVPGLGLAVNWRRLGIPLLASILLLWVVTLLPGRSVPVHNNLATNPVKPEVMSQLEDMVESIVEQPIFREDAREALKEQIQEWQRMPADRWFQPDVVEAAEHLQQQTRDALAKNAESLGTLGMALEQLSEHGLGGEQSQSMQQAAQEAIKELSMGTLPMSPEQLSEMQQMASQATQVDPETIKQWQQQLKEYAEACQQAGLLPSFEEMLANMGSSYQEGEEGSPPPGQGMPERGEGDALMSYNLDTKDLATNDAQALPKSGQAPPGEILQVSRMEQDNRGQQFDGIKRGGKSDALGEGGDAIWRDNLTPAEKRWLQEYFK